MTKYFRRLASHFSNKQPVKKAMASVRYFPNVVKDLEESDSELVHVPTEIIRASISNISKRILNHFKPVLSNASDGLYLGTAGIAYMYYHMSKVPALSRFHQEFMSHAVNYINPALVVAQKHETRTSNLPAFLLGNGGVYAVAAAIFHAIGDKHQGNQYIKMYHDAAEVCKEQRFLESGSDELFVGRAGYLLGAVWMARETGVDIQKRDLHDICRVMVKSGREYSSRHQSPSPLMYAYYNVEYFGAAHGLCSILLALMTVPEYLDSHPGDAELVKASVDFLLSLQDKEGNFPTASDEISYNENDLVHWCHGAPGMIYLMAKAYLMWKEEKYLESCKKCANLIWQKGLLKKGPGLCHGVGGNGYVFLLMYRLTGENKYLYRATTFFQFMESDEFKKNARVPDNPYSLYEGLAGTACFLADLTEPSQAAFPFTDVF